MHKFMKRALTLVLAGVMTLGMGVGALAEETTTNTQTDTNSGLTKSGNTIASDTGSINLIKDYIRVGGNTASNQSTFKYRITPYGVWNAGKDSSGADYSISAGNIPQFNTKDYSITANAGVTGTNNTQSAPVSLPTYNSVGDFWYLVQETKTNKTSATDTDVEAVGNRYTGVIYGTNSKEDTNLNGNNKNYTATYYLHVQVVNNDKYTEPPTTGQDQRTDEQKRKFNRSVTLHTIAPTSTYTNNQYNEWSEIGNKVNNIQNTYYAGSLEIKKEVDGNAADKDKFFNVTVVFTKPAGTIINSDIQYSAVVTNNNSLPGHNAEQQTYTILGQENQNSSWAASNSTDPDTAERTNTVNFWIKANQTVIFTNIPYGVTYTVTETDPTPNDVTANRYKNKIAFTSNKDTDTSWAGVNVVKDQVYESSSEVSDVDTTSFSLDFTKHAKGSITNETDAITITNQKSSSVDVGVILDNAPYVAILAIAAGALMIFLLRRKTTIEE